MYLVISMILGLLFLLTCVGVSTYIQTLFQKDEEWEKRLNTAISFEKENFSEEQLSEKRIECITKS